MKVFELLESLKEFDPEMDVILQKDPEGNGYHWLGGGDPAFIPPDTGYFIEECIDTTWSADDCDMDDDEWEKMRTTYKKVLVLFP